MRVAVGTTSQAKIKYVADFFNMAGLPVKLSCHQVDSGITEQPIGQPEIIKGAVTRARAARQQDQAADIGIGLEAGLLENSNGYALAKTDNSSLLLRCGMINPMSGGGHNHCDQLSFEFHDRGQDVIVDPGALIYSADSALRNQYRSTWAHNTLQLADLEQQLFSPRDLFAMQDQAAAKIDVWEIEGTCIRFRGHHTAYSAAGWKVSREVLYKGSEGAIYVCDSVQSLGPVRMREFCGRLHFAANIELKQTAPGVFFLRAGTLDWVLQFGEALLVEQTEGLVSPGYGIFLPASVLEYRFTAADDRDASFSLTRAKG